MHSRRYRAALVSTTSTLFWFTPLLAPLAYIHPTQCTFASASTSKLHHALLRSPTAPCLFSCGACLLRPAVSTHALLWRNACCSAGAPAECLCLVIKPDALRWYLSAPCTPWTTCLSCQPSSCELLLRERQDKTLTGRCFLLCRCIIALSCGTHLSEEMSAEQGVGSWVAGDSMHGSCTPIVFRPWPQTAARVERATANISLTLLVACLLHPTARTPTPLLDSCMSTCACC